MLFTPAALAADFDFEPCHLLRSNEAGRIESRSTGGGAGFERFRFRLETDYVGLLGVYTATEEYVAVPDDAAVAVVEWLPTVSVRPRPWLVLHAGLPLELNCSDGVVLPSLHPAVDRHVGVEPGGLFFSGQVRAVETVAFSAWGGLRYRLSKKDGTEDVSDKVVAYPESGT
ncbi:MAG: hypothetical protein ACOZNI_22120 [Myxococcota bacterium]